MTDEVVSPPSHRYRQQTSTDLRLRTRCSMTTTARCGNSCIDFAEGRSKQRGTGSGRASTGPVVPSPVPRRSPVRHMTWASGCERDRTLASASPRRRPRRYGRAPRCPHRVSGGARRGVGLGHCEGPGCRLRYRVLGQRRTRAERRTRHLEALRRSGLRLDTPPKRAWLPKAGLGHRDRRRVRGVGA